MIISLNKQNILSKSWERAQEFSTDGRGHGPTTLGTLIVSVVAEPLRMVSDLIIPKHTSGLRAILTAIQLTGLGSCRQMRPVLSIELTANLCILRVQVDALSHRLQFSFSHTTPNTSVPHEHEIPHVPGCNKPYFCGISNAREKARPSSAGRSYPNSAVWESFESLGQECQQAEARLFPAG